MECAHPYRTVFKLARVQFFDAILGNRSAKRGRNVEDFANGSPDVYQSMFQGQGDKCLLEGELIVGPTAFEILDVAK